MRGLALSTAQYSLLRVEESMNQHPKNWRPQLLLLLKVLPNEELQNRKMLHLANQLKAGRGLTMVASVLKGDLVNAEDRDRAAEVKKVPVGRRAFYTRTMFPLKLAEASSCHARGQGQRFHGGAVVRESVG